MAVMVRDLIDFCSQTLEPERFRDVAINGLQVAGRESIQRVAVAVSVNEQIIRQSIAWNADLLLVHHGLFWGERVGPISGPLRTRLSLLLASDMNLVAYHLPLDAHPTLGNNALLASALDLTVERPFAEVAGQPIGYIATSPSQIWSSELRAKVELLTGQSSIVLPGGPELVQRIGFLSGSGYSALDEAHELGCDLLLTGDVREPTMALARELGVTVIAAGHEATERLGVQALATSLAYRFGIETKFFIDSNPI